MRVFSIIDGASKTNTPVAYLLYYEDSKAFYIELPDGLSPLEVPLVLESFIKRGETFVNAYWSRVWVQNRIIPRERQNLGQILRDAGMEEYDELGLLLYAGGRCEQDDCYIREISPDALPKEIKRRFLTKVEDVVVLADASLLVFFLDGTVRRIPWNVVTSRPVPPEDKAAAEVAPGGFGIIMNAGEQINDSVLYKAGTAVPLSLKDFTRFVSERVINTAEAAELLDCSRQNIDDLVRRGRLHPVKVTSKNKLFLKGEVLQRGWK